MDEENLETKYANILEFVSNSQMDLTTKKASLQIEISQLLEIYLTQKVKYQKFRDESEKEKKRLEKEINEIQTLGLQNYQTNLEISTNH